ncbi:MAG: GGDEF domain-containing protein [Fibrobacterota bacterium]
MDSKIPLPQNAGPSIPGLEGRGDAAPLIDEEIIGIASGDMGSRIESIEHFKEVTKGYGGNFYSDLIYMLTNIRLDEAVAREDWQSILRHKHIMSEKLCRNVGIRVATLDFYTNIRKQIASPKIIDMREYTQTVRESITDPLTLCYNRRYFDYTFKHFFTLAQDTGAPLSLCMLDLDYFKLYNDKNGHITGDFALIELARILNAVTRRTDVVSRYGGEEFVVILPGTLLDEAARVAEKIRKAVDDFRFSGEQALPGGRLTVSIGAAALTPAIKGPLGLLSVADKALYRAKAEGRNRVVLQEAAA